MLETLQGPAERDFLYQLIKKSIAKFMQVTWKVRQKEICYV